MEQTHSRESFFKYTSAETAIAILQNRTLRYSMPALFNDPFDNQINLHTPFTKQEIKNKCIEEIEHIIASKSYDVFDNGGLLGAAFKFLFTAMADKSANDLRQEMKKIINDAIDNADDLTEKTNAITRQFLADSVIFCVSEVKDNLLMWSHYAQHHKGVVIELACIKELDNPLIAAQPVKYSKNLPLFASFKQWVEFFTGQTKALTDPREAMLNLIYTKSIDWKYEREWRVNIPESRAANGYVDYKEYPQVFKAIYLGCRMEPSQEKTIIEMLGSDSELIHMDIYKAQKSDSKFELRFSKMTI